MLHTNRYANEIAKVQLFFQQNKFLMIFHKFYKDFYK